MKNRRPIGNTEMRNIVAKMYPNLDFDKAMNKMVQNNLVVVCSRNKSKSSKTYNVMDKIIEKYT